MRDFIFIAALAALIFSIVRICVRKKGRYEVADITCMCCGNHWVGVYPVGTDLKKFECPKCHAQDIESKEIDMRPFLLEEKDE